MLFLEARLEQILGGSRVISCTDGSKGAGGAASLGRRRVAQREWPGGVPLAARAGGGGPPSGIRGISGTNLRRERAGFSQGFREVIHAIRLHFLVCQRPSIAPVGSTMMLSQPIFATSLTSFITFAPRD